jgi:hypothetical protein
VPEVFVGTVEALEGTKMIGRPEFVQISSIRQRLQNQKIDKHVNELGKKLFFM